MTLDGDSLVVYNAPIARRKLGLAGIPGSGTVVGPAVSTDKSIARYDGASGAIIEDSIPLVEDDGRISTLTDPTGAQDAATKGYVDTAVAGVGGSFAPLVHATRHQSGGADPIALDTLAPPSDNTTLDASIAAHGLMRKLSNNPAEFYNGQGAWATPAGGGDVTGPVGATDDNITTFNGATGTVIQDSGVAITQVPSTDEKAALAGTNGTPGAANPYVTDSDSRNTNARTPTAHATSHESLGSDAIKLDDLAAPDDNTDLNATAGSHGLMPKLSGNAAEFFDGTGGWSTPAGGGDVVGPASSVDDRIATFDGITGKLIQDSGVSILNVPSTDEKAALAGSDGVPSAVNPYVTDSDARNSNSRTPTAHAASHEDSGTDEIDVTGLAGVLTDAQKIVVRKNSGADVGTRSRINFIEGANVTLTVTDDAGDGEVDVTIAATAGATQKRGAMLALCLAYTPLAIGADRGEITVPYDPDDGTTGLTWNIRRITLRVSVAGGAPSVRIEKSTAATAFSAATVGDVTLGSGDYEGSNTTALGTVVSGNKLRMNPLALATAEFWTVTVELGEN